MSQLCTRFNCYVGPAICDVCPESDSCENRARRKELKRGPTTGKTKLPGDRVCQRRKALKLVERDLQRTFLYETTGHPVHSDCEWKEDVLPSVSLPVVEGQGEVNINQEIESILDQKENL